MSPSSASTDSNLLLIVARAPLPGCTKSRLASSIGDEAAALLHQSFLQDLATRFMPPSPHERQYATGWAFTPDDFDFAALIATLAPETMNQKVLFVSQQGEHLGERLTDLVGWSTDQGFVNTILMASDSPQLPVRVVSQAFDSLTRHDIVIGRVLDGGYYLVGVRGFTDILSQVPMSTTDAADGLVRLARERGLSVAELDPAFDVDVVEDLVNLCEYLGREGGAAPSTWETLKRLGLARKLAPEALLTPSNSWNY